VDLAFQDIRYGLVGPAEASIVFQAFDAARRFGVEIEYDRPLLRVVCGPRWCRDAWAEEVQNRIDDLFK